LKLITRALKYIETGKGYVKKKKITLKNQKKS
jgi:hypothetical protein